MPAHRSWVVAASRALTVAGVVTLVGVLPWLSGRSPELSLLRARSAEQEATPEALAAIRRELGLDAGPLPLLGRWLGDVLRGDLGTSWTSGAPVGPGIAAALGVSLTLMVLAVAVAAALTAVLCAPVLLRIRRGAGGRPAGVAGAALTALPEFLLASVLLTVGAVWLGWFPPYGWTGPRDAVLPALALGLPAGGLLGRLFADALSTTATERWVVTWQAAGARPGTVARAVVRRSLPALMPQLGLVLIGLTGGAIAVEQVFAVPGLGRATLGAAEAQDLPTLQAGVLALLALAAVTGLLATVVRRLLIGRALHSGSLSVPAPIRVPRRRDWAVPAGCAAVLTGIVFAGTGRDPHTSAHPRLAPPSATLPFGADASGRDLLARVAHGSLTTLGTALTVVALCLLLGLLVGLLPRASTGPVEVANAAPPVIAGILVAAVAGSSVTGAVIAVTLVGWAPLAAHTSALSTEVRAQPHVRILPVLGVGPLRVCWQHVVPAVLGPVTRHAVLRLPGIALALAALGFLGLGPRPPSPEWGLLLAEGLPYVERAPWTVLAPTAVLVVASLLAVSLSSVPVEGGWLRRAAGALSAWRATEPGPAPGSRTPGTPDQATTAALGPDPGRTRGGVPGESPGRAAPAGRAEPTPRAGRR